MTRADVAALEHAMGELLSATHEPGAGADQIQAAWSRCEAAGQTLTAVLEGAAELNEEEAAELRTGLDRLLLLNALVRGAIVEEQQSLAQALTRAREAGVQLRAYTPGSPDTAGLGGSCDLAG